MDQWVEAPALVSAPYANPQADALAGRDYLVGNSFTVADLNVAGILVWGKMGRLNLSDHAAVTRWFDACLARPAYGRVRDRASRK
jgi:glutathione S-transferase